MLNTEEVDVSNEDGTAPQQQWRKPTFHGVYKYTDRFKLKHPSYIMRM